MNRRQPRGGHVGLAVVWSLVVLAWLVRGGAADVLEPKDFEPIPKLSEAAGSEGVQPGFSDRPLLARLRSVHGRDASTSETVWVESALTPARLLMIAGRPEVRLFPGPWQPTHVALGETPGSPIRAGGFAGAQMRAPWLLAWDGGEKGKAYLVYFADRPERIELAGGVKVTYGPAVSSSQVVLLPLLGDDTADTRAWQAGVPAAMVEKCRYWAPALAYYPLDVEEQYGLDFKADAITVRERFDFVHVPNAWGAAGKLRCPISPAVSCGLKHGFPITLDAALPDGDAARLRLSTGEYVQVDGPGPVGYTLHGLLKYMNEVWVIDRPAPSAQYSKPLEEGLRGDERGYRLPVTVFSIDESVVGTGIRTDFQGLTQKLPYLPEADRAQLVTAMTNYAQRVFFNPDEYFTLDIGGFRHALDKCVWIGATAHGGVYWGPSLEWNYFHRSLPVSAGGLLGNIHAVAKARGDYGWLRPHWPHLQSLAAHFEHFDWATSGHESAGRGPHFWIVYGNNVLPTEAFFNNVMIEGCLAYGRIAWHLDKRAEYQRACYLLGKYLLGGFAEVHAWPSRKSKYATMPAAYHYDLFKEWEAKYLTGGWVEDARGLTMEQYRFFNEHLKREVVEDLTRFEQTWREREPERPSIKMVPSVAIWEAKRLRDEIQKGETALQSARDSAAAKRLQSQVDRDRRKLAGLQSPFVGVLQAMAFVGDYPVERLKQLGADPLTLARREEQGHWQATIWPVPEKTDPASGVRMDREGVEQYLGEIPWRQPSWQKGYPHPWRLREPPGTSPQQERIQSQYDRSYHQVVGLRLNRATTVTCVTGGAAMVADKLRRGPGGAVYLLSRDDRQIRRVNGSAFETVYQGAAEIRDFAVDVRGRRLFVVSDTDADRSTRIPAWHRLGPFDNARDEGFDQPLPPEKAVDLSAVCRGKDGQELRWQKVDERALGLSGKMILAYAFGQVASDADKTVEFTIVTECGVKVWVNGTIVYTHHAHACHSAYNRAVERPRPDRFEVSLRKGENTILVKYDKPEKGYALGFTLRLGEIASDLPVIAADGSQGKLTVPLRAVETAECDDQYLVLGGRNRICLVSLATGQVARTVEVPGARIAHTARDASHLYAVAVHSADYFDYYDEMFLGRREEMAAGDTLYKIELASGKIVGSARMDGQVRGLAVDAGQGHLAVAHQWFQHPTLSILRSSDLSPVRELLLEEIGPLAADAAGNRLYVLGPGQDLLTEVDLRSFQVKALRIQGAHTPGTLLTGEAGLVIGFRHTPGLVEVRPDSTAIVAKSSIEAELGRHPPQRFAAPVETGWIFRRFGPQRDGFDGHEFFNASLDIVHLQGWPVTAAADGIVSFAGFKSDELGHVLVVRHGGGWETRYAHLRRMPSRQPGEFVRQGEVVATLGETGAETTLPYLAFEVRHNGLPVDPLTVLEGGQRGLLRITDRTPVKNPSFEGPDEEAMGDWKPEFARFPWPGDAKIARFSIDREHAHHGKQSLKAEIYEDFQNKGISHSPALPVKENTFYVLDYWVYLEHGAQIYGHQCEVSVNMQRAPEDVRLYSWRAYWHTWANIWTPGCILSINVHPGYNRYGTGNQMWCRNAGFIGREGNWFHYRTAPVNTRANTCLRIGQEDRQNATPEGLRRWLAEKGTPWIPIIRDEYRLLECEIVGE